MINKIIKRFQSKNKDSKDLNLGKLPMTHSLPREEHKIWDKVAVKHICSRKSMDILP